MKLKSHVSQKIIRSQKIMREVKESQGSSVPLGYIYPSLYEKRTFHLGSSHIALRVCSLFFEERGVAPMSHYWG